MKQETRFHVLKATEAGMKIPEPYTAFEFLLVDIGHPHARSLAAPEGQVPCMIMAGCANSAAAHMRMAALNAMEAIELMTQDALAVAAGKTPH